MGEEMNLLSSRNLKLNPLVAILAIGFAAEVLMATITLFLIPASPASQNAISEEGRLPEIAAPGSPAIDFEAVSLHGDKVRLSDFRGQIVALNFWATWCAPCLVEMPALQAAQDQFGSQGFTIVAVNAGEPTDTVSDFMTSHRITYLTLMDPNLDIVNLYHIRAFPTTIWITPAGTVEAKHLGPLDLDLMDQYIAALIDRS